MAIETPVKLSLKNIQHTYVSASGEETASLQHVDLDVYDGELLAILGSSGCGKSTLLNIMCGMLTPSAGEVLLDGKPIKGAKHKIGYMSQTDTLLPWRKIIHNVAVGLELEGVPKKERLRVAADLIETSGLSGFEHKYPAELSGGMRKRAIIIRALAQNPDILFMDEPFGPLDVFTREMLQQEILKVWRQYQKTIVYITHDIAEAIFMADRIVLMSYRPSVVKQIYRVDIPRPRVFEDCRFHPAFLRLEKEIWQNLRQEVEKAQSEEYRAHA